MAKAQLRRQNEATVLYARMVFGGESFWQVVYQPFMDRDVTRAVVRQVVERGLRETGGYYRVLMHRFNVPQADYKRFMNVLRKHGCHIRCQEHRRPHESSAPETVEGR